MEPRGICEAHNKAGCICLMRENKRNTDGGWKMKPRSYCINGHELTADNTLLVGKTRKRRCKFCAQEKANEWHKNHPDQVRKAVRNVHRRLLYGVTEAMYNDLLEKQNGVCAICKQPPEKELLCIDHDHVTNKVRGLLHRVCNTGIGNLKDDAVLCRQAAEYLERAAQA